MRQTENKLLTFNYLKCIIIIVYNARVIQERVNNMKKIVSILLVLCTVFSFFACKKNNKEDVSEIEAIINNSDPTKIVTIVDYVNGDMTLNSSYITEKDTSDGEQRFEYSYQRMSIPGVDDSSSTVTTVSGVVYQAANGDKFGDTEAEVEAPAYLLYSLNINVNSLSSYTLSEDLKSFEALIPANRAKIVFGTDLSADGDIKLKITTNGEYLYSVYIEYVTHEVGATVVINTSYDYTDNNLELPGSDG